jgi:hypothetical protein
MVLLSEELTSQSLAAVCGEKLVQRVTKKGEVEMRVGVENYSPDSVRLHCAANLTNIAQVCKKKLTTSVQCMYLWIVSLFWRFVTPSMDDHMVEPVLYIGSRKGKEEEVKKNDNYGFVITFVFDFLTTFVYMYIFFFILGVVVRLYVGFINLLVRTQETYNRRRKSDILNNVRSQAKVDGVVLDKSNLSDLTKQVNLEFHPDKFAGLEHDRLEAGDRYALFNDSKDAVRQDDLAGKLADLMDLNPELVEPVNLFNRLDWKGNGSAIIGAYKVVTEEKSNTILSAVTNNSTYKEYCAKTVIDINDFKIDGMNHLVRSKKDDDHLTEIFSNRNLYAYNKIVELELESGQFVYITPQAGGYCAFFVAIMHLLRMECSYLVKLQAQLMRQFIIPYHSIFSDSRLKREKADDVVERRQFEDSLWHLLNLPNVAVIANEKNDGKGFPIALIQAKFEDLGLKMMNHINKVDCCFVVPHPVNKESAHACYVSSRQLPKRSLRDGSTDHAVLKDILGNYYNYELCRAVIYTHYTEERKLIPMDIVRCCSAIAISFSCFIKDQHYMSNVGGNVRPEILISIANEAKISKWILSEELIDPKEVVEIAGDVRLAYKLPSSLSHLPFSQGEEEFSGDNVRIFIVSMLSHFRTYFGGRVGNVK